MTKSSCPVADVPTYRRRDALPDGEELLYPECNEFHTRTHSRIRELQPDLVIFPVLSRYHLVNNRGIAAFSAGLGDSISAIAGLGTKVLVLGETPKPMVKIFRVVWHVIKMTSLFVQICEAELSLHSALNICRIRQPNILQLM